MHVADRAGRQDPGAASRSASAPCIASGSLGLLGGSLVPLVAFVAIVGDSDVLSVPAVGLPCPGARQGRGRSRPRAGDTEHGHGRGARARQGAADRAGQRRVRGDGGSARPTRCGAAGRRSSAARGHRASDRPDHLPWLRAITDGDPAARRDPRASHCGSEAALQRLGQLDVDPRRRRHLPRRSRHVRRPDAGRGPERPAPHAAQAAQGRPGADAPAEVAAPARPRKRPRPPTAPSRSSSPTSATRSARR